MKLLIMHNIGIGGIYLLPGLKRRGWRTFPVLDFGAGRRAALSLRFLCGALPPVDLLAVWAVRGIFYAVIRPSSNTDLEILTDVGLVVIGSYVLCVCSCSCLDRSQNMI